MSDKANDGGPAFPSAVIERDFSVDEKGRRELACTSFKFASMYGMTLLQWYAGEAMKAILASSIQQDGDPTGWLFCESGKVTWNHTYEHIGCKQVARLAREMAEAMVEELAAK